MHQYYVILYRAFFEHQCAAVHLLLPSASELTPSVWRLEVGWVRTLEKWWAVSCAWRLRLATCRHHGITTWPSFRKTLIKWRNFLTESAHYDAHIMLAYLLCSF